MGIKKLFSILIILLISLYSKGQNEETTNNNHMERFGYGIDDLGIVENEEASNLYVRFFNLYDEGIELKKIKEEVEKEWITNPEDILFKELCLVAYVKALWEIDKSDKKLTVELEDIVNKELTKDNWEYIEKGLWEERKKILENFLNQIKTPIESKIERDLPPPLKKNIFEQGDILSIKLDNGNYGCVIVHNLFPHRGVYEYGFNIIDYYDIIPPSIDSIIMNNNVYQVQNIQYANDINQMPPYGFELCTNQNLIEQKLANFNKIGNHKYSKKFINATYSGSSKWEGFLEYFPFEENVMFELDKPINGRAASKHFKVPINKL